MIEYTTALILIFLTYIVAVINIKIPIFGILVVIIDVMVLLPEPLQTGLVIIGYTIENGIATPVTQSFSWLTIIGVIGIAFCIMTAIIKMTGEMD